jgi:hypothetical protein
MAKEADVPVKAITVKLSDPDYWALHEYCLERGRKLGRRVTHQEAAVQAIQRLVAVKRGKAEAA